MPRRVIASTASKPGASGGRGERVGGHDRRQRRVVGEAEGKTAAAQVAVGDDAAESPSVDHQQGRNALAGHPHGGLANRLGCPCADRRASNEGGKRQAAEVAFDRQTRAAPGLAQALPEIAERLLAQLRVVSPELFQVSLRQAIKQRVLDCASAPLSFQRVGQAGRIMNVALGHPSGELSVGRTQLDGPLAEQPQAGVSVWRKGGATPQIANHEMPGQRGQAGYIEAIEGRTMLQEIAYLGQFVMHVAFPFRVVSGLPGSCGGLEPWPVRPARHRGTPRRRSCPASLQNNWQARKSITAADLCH
jgi:hypothetical protein